MNKTQLLLVAAAMTLVSPLPVLAADFQVGDKTTLTVGGLLAVGVKDSEITNIVAADTRSPKNEISVLDNTSRVIFAGNSEIIPGWKAIFYIESRFTTNVSPIDPLLPGLPASMSQYTAGNMTGWANGTTWGGVQGPMGKLYFGKSTLYYLDGVSADYFGAPAPGENYRAWDGNGLGVFNMLSQVGTSMKNGAVGLPLATLQIDRSQNVIRFDSARYQGFELSLAYTKNPFGQQNIAGAEPLSAGRGYSDGGTVYAGLKYTQGPFTAFASVLNSVLEGGYNNSLQAIYLNALAPGLLQGPLDTHAYRFGAGYVFADAFKVGVVVDTTAFDNGILGSNLTAKRTVIQVPLSYGWDKHRVYLTYNKAGNTTNLPDSGATQVTAGYDYALTKKCFVGGFYTSLTNQSNGNYQPFLAGTVLGNSAPMTGENWHQFSIDINYWF